MFAAGAWLLAEAYPVAFWSSAAALSALIGWGVVLRRRNPPSDVLLMSPVEYELFCARLLADAGWSVRHVGGLDDQGVDAVAELRGVRVAVQAKKYSRPAGNAAVQEVVAGKLYHRCVVAAVVCPVGYTRPAKQLAHANGVLLLCHDELHDLERLARVP
jgi:restriction system protein